MTKIANDGHYRECNQHGGRCEQPRQQRRLHEVQIGALDHHHHCAQPHEQDNGFCVPRLIAHRRGTPVRRPSRRPWRPRVAGPKRSANARPNIPGLHRHSFTSTAGPTTRNTNRGSSGTMVRLAATNASASEHSASTTASSAMVTTPSDAGDPRDARNTQAARDSQRCGRRGTDHQIGRGLRKSWRAASVNTVHRDVSLSCGFGKRAGDPFGRPQRDQSSPSPRP